MPVELGRRRSAAMGRFVRQIAARLVTRIAREWVIRTFEALRQRYTRSPATTSCCGDAGRIGVPCARTSSW